MITKLQTPDAHNGSLDIKYSQIMWRKVFAAQRYEKKPTTPRFKLNNVNRKLRAKLSQIISRKYAKAPLKYLCAISGLKRSAGFFNPQPLLCF